MCTGSGVGEGLIDAEGLCDDDGLVEKLIDDEGLSDADGLSDDEGLSDNDSELDGLVDIDKDGIGVHFSLLQCRGNPVPETSENCDRYRKHHQTTQKPLTYFTTIILNHSTF